MTSNEDILRSALTEQQYEAAIAPEDEVLALACAGSGKSRTLAYRIAYMIACQQNPSSFLAFTFTDKAAESIKLRVTRALEAFHLDPLLVGAMNIGTIHGWCHEILGKLDAKYRQFEVLDDMRFQIYVLSRYGELMRDIPGLRESHPRGAFRAPLFLTIKKICDAYKLINEESLELSEVSLHDNTLGQVMSRLEVLLERDRFIDFTSMIRRVVDELESGGEGVERAFGDLKHLLVDEYQDVNPLQERLIRLLHLRGGSLFVVGDDDQAIYAWRGADVGNILSFTTRYPDAAEHSLPHNFRSTPAIVAVADSFVASELGANRLPKTPTATPSTAPHEFAVTWFTDRNEESEWIANRIAQLLGSAYQESDGTIRGLTPADFAILMRSTGGDEQDGTRRHSAFSNALANRGIHYYLEAGGGLFDRPLMAAVLDALELLRSNNPDRNVVRTIYDDTLIQLFPYADFTEITNVYSEWGRRIHQPIADGVPRQRLFPQILLQELLAALGIARAEFDPGVMADLGVLSRIFQDFESVYVSIDSSGRFSDLLNFLQNVASEGYEVQAERMARPDAVTISTVHKMKGLEFPVVFLGDVEAQRFPPNARKYEGWIPEPCMQPILQRGAYGADNRNGEARLFYTALTRAERYLYISGSKKLPGAKSDRKVSPYSVQLQHEEIRRDVLDVGAQPLVTPSLITQRRRGDESILPTTYSQIRYYLRCPHDYLLRNEYGFSPPIVEMFGYGQTVHTAIGKLHEQFPDRAPTGEDVRRINEEVFHLKHVPPSKDPINRPGGYENAKNAAEEILARYSTDFRSDFLHERQVERSFEVPVKDAVISGAIDLLLHLDEDDNVLGVGVIDFKTIEGGPDAMENDDLDWGDLSLQVQLYATGAIQVLGENARTGSVHLLKDSQRIEVPVDDAAMRSAVENVEWAVGHVIKGDFPMRPSPSKCEACDFKIICPQQRGEFSGTDLPPELHLPEGHRKMAPVFSDVIEN